MFKRAIAAGALALPMAAFADVPTAVSTALSDAATDGVTVAGLVIVAIVGIYAFSLMRRALR